jgi:hypothetical protein
LEGIGEKVELAGGLLHEVVNLDFLLLLEGFEGDS